jgi:hypothetical protein
VLFFTISGVRCYFRRGSGEDRPTWTSLNRSQTERFAEEFSYGISGFRVKQHVNSDDLHSLKPREPAFSSS